MFAVSGESMVFIAYSRGTMSARFVKFALVGMSNTLIHFVSYFAIINFVGSQAFSNLIAFFLASVWSYCVNARLTFEVTPAFRRYLRFFVFNAILSSVVGMISDHLGFSVVVAPLLFSLISLVLNYIFSRRFVFG